MATPARSLINRAGKVAFPVQSALVKQAMKPALTPGRALRLRSAPTLEAAVAGKVVVVTGASSGIGEATAKLVASSGAITVLVARRREELERVAGEISGSELSNDAKKLGRSAPEALFYECDLSDLEQVAALGDQLLADLGRIDVLVNNAGRSIRRPIDESFDRMHDFHRTMQINYFGPVQLTLKLLPGMLENGSGQIVNVATWGVQFEANPLFAAYAASKAAITAFGRSVNSETGDRGVRVSTVYPALIRTPMIGPTESYSHRPALAPEDAANMIGEAIRTKASRVAPAVSSGMHLLDAVTTSPMDRLSRMGFA